MPIISGEEKERKKAFIILENMLTLQSWKKAVTENCWKVKKSLLDEKKNYIRHSKEWSKTQLQKQALRHLT